MNKLANPLMQVADSECKSIQELERMIKQEPVNRIDNKRRKFLAGLLGGLALPIVGTLHPREAFAEVHKKLDIGRKIIIAIDPGHGGKDPGAIGKNGTYEKHITYALADLLRHKFNAEPNIKAVLTRNGDQSIQLQDRVSRARENHADVFISIHADAFVKPDTKGSSVFALSESGASNSVANWLAKSQNDADRVAGIDLSKKDRYLARTLFDLSQTATIQDSIKLGKALLNEIGKINTLHRSIVDQAEFAVLKSPDIPSILIETAFLSNPQEEAKLQSQAFRNKFTSAVVYGVYNYLIQNPPIKGSAKIALNK